MSRRSDAAVWLLDGRLAVAMALASVRPPAKPKAPPKPPGKHRAPDSPRPGNGIAWWIWTAVATGYAWLTWRMAVIELPTMTGLGAGMTLALAYTAGRTRKDHR